MGSYRQLVLLFVLVWCALFPLLFGSQLLVAEQNKKKKSLHPPVPWEYSVRLIIICSIVFRIFFFVNCVPGYLCLEALLTIWNLSFLAYLPLLFLMAPRKSKASTKERVCSDPFIVNDDDSVAGSEDDDYEESVLLFIFIKCSVLTILC